MTAENLTGTFMTKNTINIKGVSFASFVPEVSFHFEIAQNSCNNQTYGNKTYHINDVYDRKADYIISLKKTLKHKRKCVIFIDDGKIGDELKSWITELFPERVLFFLKGSLAVVDKFYNEKRRSILFVNSMSNEGLNLLVEHIIIFKASMMSVTRVRQTIGRTKRPNNPHKKVTCTFIGGNRLDLLKSYYASLFSGTEWELGFEDYPEPHFLRGADILSRVLGKNISELHHADGVVLFDPIRNSGREKKVMEWWLEHHSSKDTILSPDIISKIYL
jgi:5S rRNA maturation endonuclease (ribonuclease M5)